MSLDDIKKLRTQFLDVIDGAISNLENGVEVYATVKHSAYSFVEEDNRLVTREAKYIIKQIEGNYSAVPNTELFNLDYEDISGYKHKSDFVLEIFDGQGNIATNNEIGTVELMKRGAKSTMLHGYGELKAATVKAIKPVIEGGKVVAHIENYNNADIGNEEVPIDRYIIAGKGIVKNKNVVLGVMVEAYPTQKHNNKFYLHEAVIVEADLPITTDSQGEKTVGKSASINIIAQNTKNGNTKKSLDVDSEGTTLSKEQIRRYKNVAPELRDEQGRIKPFYHGTSRADRVGNYFNPERATSGPMAYFTDNAEIAQNYSKSKQDTSLAYDNDYDSYESQFRVNGKPITEYWYTLSAKQKQELTQKIKQVTFDDDYESIILKPGNEYGIGNFNDYELHLAKGNAIQVLVDGWLGGGTLWNEESRFIEVLDKVGIKNVEYKDPNYREEKVYKVYLNVTNPFNTADVDEEFISDLEDYVSATDMSIYDTETAQADMWDKNSVDIYDWIEILRSDLQNGTTHAWTSIPDVVTDFLKEYGGYNGIVDKGGKNGGEIHTVVIPFYSNQIKNVDNLNPTDSEDIRYSKDVDFEEYDENFDRNVIDSFGIAKINDYRHVQIQVFNTLVNEGFFDEKASRIVTNANSGMKVEINESGIEEAFDPKNYGNRGKRLKILKLASIRHVPDIIENGTLTFDNEKNYHNDNSNVKYAYIEGQTILNGKPVTIRITVRKSLQKNKFWVHNIYTNEKNTTDLSAGESFSKTDYLTDSDSDMITQDLSNVKFSKDVEDYDVKSLIKQNKKLQKSVEYYKMMMGYNNGHKVDRKKIRQYAAELKKTYNSTMSKDEIADDLTEIFDFISSGDATWDTVVLKEKGNAPVRNIISAIGSKTVGAFPNNSVPQKQKKATPKNFLMLFTILFYILRSKTTDSITFSLFSLTWKSRNINLEKRE
ncbi:MAG: hypothetical protein ACI4IE_02140 [Eubacterium sp.]